MVRNPGVARATPGTHLRTNTARARAPGPTPRLDEVKRKRKTGRQEDSVGSGAGQGPWSSAASAPTAIRGRRPTPTRRSSRATGKLWGENTGKKRGTEKRRGKTQTGSSFFSLLLKKRIGMDTSEASTRASVEEGRRQPSLREARQPDSRTTPREKLLLF